MQFGNQEVQAHVAVFLVNEGVVLRLGVVRRENAIKNCYW